MSKSNSPIDSENTPTSGRSAQQPMSSTSRSLHPRALLYLGVASLLVFLSFWLRDLKWQGDIQLHTLMEVIATVLAFYVGTLALIRFFNQNDAVFLYIGAGFIGTAVLDGYHTVVTSIYFQAYLPSDNLTLVPWSWVASRMYLSILLALSWYLWYRSRHEPESRPNQQRVFGVAAITTIAGMLLFALIPLPSLIYADAWLPRPVDLLPGLFFLIALVGYLNKGNWRTDSFEHWLVLSLIVGFMMQMFFMSFSGQIYDLEFNAAHLFKKLSYILVLIGLMVSLRETYQQIQHDITERKRAEDVIRESEFRFRIVADFTWDWEFWMGGDRQFVYLSPSCERITGHAAAEFVRSSSLFLDIVHPDDTKSMEAQLERVFLRQTETGFDFRIIHREGNVRWLSMAYQPILNSEGSFLGARGSIRDITERKQTEEALRASESRYRLLVQNLPYCVHEIDSLSRLISMNPAGLAMMCVLDESEIRGMRYLDIVADSDKDRISRLLDLALQGQSSEFEFVATNKCHYQSSFMPILDEAGVVQRLMGLTQDITERKQQQNEILRLNASLEERVQQRTEELEEKAAQLTLTSQYKSEFLSNMSHELRTPLNSLLILAQLLAENAEHTMSGQQIEYAKIIQGAGKDLLALINDILDLSKIESGTVTLELQDVSFANVREQVERSFRHVATSRGLGFDVELAPSLPPSLYTDSQRLQQVMKNLLSNAFKFTVKGQVSVRIAAVESGWSVDHDGLNRAQMVIGFHVTDSGIGLPTTKQKIIFEAFHQADTGSARKYGGTGLGLSISRELAWLLGGELRLVASEPGKGSTFVLYLPLRAPEPGQGRTS